MYIGVRLQGHVVKIIKIYLRRIAYKHVCCCISQESMNRIYEYNRVKMKEDTNWRPGAS